MPETQLSGRQIRMVVLVVVMLMGGLLAYVFTVLPTNNDPVGSRRAAIGAGVIAAVAGVWFAKLVFDAVRERRRGIERGPAKVGGWFDVWFGAAVAAGGVGCSALTYHSADPAGGGVWTLYYGMIAWGII